MKESQFQKKVIEHLIRESSWVLKTWSNGVQRSGVPDVIACVNGYFLGIELKNETGQPSALQLWNIREIRKANGIAIVLRPQSWQLFRDTIMKYLKEDNHEKAYQAQYIFDEARWCL